MCTVERKKQVNVAITERTSSRRIATNVNRSKAFELRECIKELAIGKIDTKQYSMCTILGGNENMKFSCNSQRRNVKLNFAQNSDEENRTEN